MQAAAAAAEVPSFEVRMITLHSHELTLQEILEFEARLRSVIVRALESTPNGLRFEGEVSRFSNMSSFEDRKVESKMRHGLAGSRVRSESDFHRELSALLDFGPHYGCNLNALWDRLSADLERPILLVWTKSEQSRAAMGTATFDAIVAVLERTRRQDLDFGWSDRFDYRVE
ncbi:barstar family protein [Sandaracinus amylolyticus]|uniref:barstar family protein n=1 Tax=Sandaracinus amylolyticus TaxID=927083 RepID=UPI001F4464ED|nr:barstar family protein [Sandaracinus amylolyticus]UJR78592.1 Hypothetical protein I5071_6230 [Sandaracinus amylolyticus]